MTFNPLLPPHSNPLLAGPKLPNKKAYAHLILPSAFNWLKQVCPSSLVRLLLYIYRMPFNLLRVISETDSSELAEHICHRSLRVGILDEGWALLIFINL